MAKDPMSNLVEGQDCFRKVQPPVNHRCFSEACFPRRRTVGNGPGVLLGHTPAIFGTGSLFFSARKSGQRGRAKFCPVATRERQYTFHVVGTSSSRRQWL